MDQIGVLHYAYILVTSVASCCFVYYVIVLALSFRFSRHHKVNDQQDADVDVGGSTMVATDTPLELAAHDPPPSPKQAETSSSSDELSTNNSTASSSSSSVVCCNVIRGANKLKKRNKGSNGSTAATADNIVSNAIDDTQVLRRVSFTSEVELSYKVPSSGSAAAAAATAQSNSLRSSRSVHALPAPSLVSNRNSSLGSLLKPSGGSLTKQSLQASKKKSGAKESIEVRYANEVRLIVEMGFEMKQAVEAIEKTFGNVDSAVSWLLMSSSSSSSELDDELADAPPIAIHDSSASSDSMVTAEAVGASSPHAEDEVDTTNESKDSSPPASVEDSVFINTNTTTTLSSPAQQQLPRAVRNPQPCRHFLTRYGCRQGGRCKFLHDPSLVDGRRDSSAFHRSANDTWIDNRRGTNDYARGSSIHQMVTRPDNTSIVMDRSRASNSSIDARHRNDDDRPIYTNGRGGNALTAPHRQQDGSSSTKWLTHAHTGTDSTATRRVSNMSVDSRPIGNNSSSSSSSSRWFPNRQFDNSDGCIDLNNTEHLLAFVHRRDHASAAVGIIASANDPISPEIGPAKNAPKSPVIGPANSSKQSFIVQTHPFKEDQSVLLPPSRYPIDPSWGSLGSNSYRHRWSDPTGVHPVMTRQENMAPSEEVGGSSSRWFGACPPSPIGASTHFVYTSAGLVLQSEQQHTTTTTTTTAESVSSHNSGGHYIYVGGVLKPL